MTMTKEYRAELKQLRAAKKILTRDLAKADREIKKTISQLQRTSAARAVRTQRETRKIDTRIAILEGRLS
jgi:hypothetical protein